MDYFRGTRRNKSGQSSKNLISELKTENTHNQNIKLAFFKNPSTSNLLNFSQESGLREIFGVHHMKIYIFDNDVIISGANLSEDYFINRQDRYFLIKNSPDLSNYLEDLINIISSNSYILNDEGDFTMVNEQPDSSSSKFLQTFKQHFKLFSFANKINTKKIEFENNFKLYEDDDYKAKFNVKMEKNNEEKNIDTKPENEVKVSETKIAVDLDSEETIKKEIIPKYYKKDEILVQKMEEKKEAAKLILTQSFSEGDVANIVRKLEQSIYKEDEKGDLVDYGGKVYIFPVYQIPCLKVNDDENLFIKFIEHYSKKSDSIIKLASGYMNLTSKITDLISKTDAQINLLTASPSSNGFYQAGRIKGLIPFMYRVFELKLFNQLKGNNNFKVKIYEYSRGEWTFHTKGLWLYENSEEKPSLTIVGSSNFSQRSYRRDNEIQFYMYSLCPKFKQKIEDENLRLFNNSHIVEKENIVKDQDVKIKWRHRILYYFLNSYL